MTSGLLGEVRHGKIHSRNVEYSPAERYLAGTLNATAAMLFNFGACCELVASFTDMPTAWERVIVLADYNAGPPMRRFRDRRSCPS